MIAYIKGKPVSKTENSVVIDVGGIGYLVNMPSGDIAQIGEQSITVHTYLQIREDNPPELYGFLSTEQLSYFHKLIAISGVGPKAALALLSALAPKDIALAVISEDVKSITRAQGIGTKMAQRIILELKGKIDTADAVGVPKSQQTGAATYTLRADTEAVNALIALGASPSEAQKTIMQMDTANLSTEEIIKEALRRMSNGI